ncbi:ABC transporter ATP-binding protein [Corynebacterium sp. TAE3-ERU12]|uniref:ATP-binding cassette domain-containing protein n=1 Tax=Corynebacterium sp. TAE3-ERU12 TaxID=2849491 RepID=UPI001C451AFC|nr:ABC transporter ATP-binding protein [Corynebacterium sp. TAE3-ERU12]MBV7296026.1 ABC transporter ATP-binding protein [Corynebacterium sp. TAE3-ERU12]
MDDTSLPADNQTNTGDADRTSTAQQPTYVPKHAAESSAAAQPPESAQPSDTDAASDAASDSSVPPCVIADDLGVTGDEGPVYGPLSVVIPGDGLTLLTGRGGSGRTALALTIAGRMRPDAGDLEVLGFTDIDDIRPHVAIAGVEQIDLLDRDVRISDVLREHLSWSTPWYKPAPKPTQEYFEELTAEVFGPRTLPPMSAYISQLAAVDKHLIRISLALHPADGSEIGLLVVDDLEQVHSPVERMTLFSRLLAISERIPVVVNSAEELPTDILPAERQVLLDTNAGHFSPEVAGVDRRLLKLLRKESHR